MWWREVWRGTFSEAAVGRSSWFSSAHGQCPPVPPVLERGQRSFPCFGPPFLGLLMDCSPSSGFTVAPFRSFVLCVAAAGQFLCPVCPPHCLTTPSLGPACSSPSSLVSTGEVLPSLSESGCACVRTDQALLSSPDSDLGSAVSLLLLAVSPRGS